MINVINESTSPFFNLALEEYLLKEKNMPDDVFILWQNSPTVVIGKNQNTLEEIDSDYVRENNIYVVRRLSGGGAVYHDSGNLNFTFIMKDFNIKNDFSFFAGPVIGCLSSLGVKAEFDGRNDITIEGKKFSGNAQYFHKKKLLHHGTILFDSDLSILGNVLKAKKKYASNAVKSVNGRVTNLKDYLGSDMNIEKFKETLINSIFSYHRCRYAEYRLDEEDTARIEELAQKRYHTWAWNYGHSPAFNFSRELVFSGGSIIVRLFIREGIISECRIYGDYFENRPVEDLENLLKKQKYEKVNLISLLSKNDVSEYIKGLETVEFVSLLF